MKKNLVPLLGIAFVVAIVATGIFYGLFVGKLRSPASFPRGPSVVVAARAMDRGDIIQPADVKVVSWAGGDGPKGAFGSVDQVKGLTIVNSLQENEPVLAARVASRESGLGAGLGIPPGMRAVSIRATDSSGVIGMLKAGHKVDVQVVSPAGAPPELRTILQDVEVLTVLLSPDGRTPVVNLLVRPEEADAVGLADSVARVRLVLRNPLDGAQPSRGRQTLAPLFQKALDPGRKKGK